ncbi:MAG: hypothetical protein JWO36_1248, partial [Myxococcales bacterium]|nr:hypothetical protein [Myxococcales bacterium]
MKAWRLLCRVPERKETDMKDNDQKVID